MLSRYNSLSSRGLAHVLVSGILKSKLVLVLLLTMVATMSCGQKQENAPAATGLDEKKILSTLDSCLVWCSSENPDMRCAGRKAAAALVLEVAMDSTKYSPELLGKCLDKSDTIQNRFFMQSDNKRVWLEHEVMCGDDWVWFSMIYDNGKIERMMIDYPMEAKANFALRFTNKSMEELVEGNSQLDYTDELVRIDEYFQTDTDGRPFAYLDEKTTQHFLDRKYVYFLYTDEDDNLQSYYQSLTFFHKQLQEALR